MQEHALLLTEDEFDFFSGLRADEKFHGIVVDASNFHTNEAAVNDFCELIS